MLPIYSQSDDPAVEPLEIGQVDEARFILHDGSRMRLVTTNVYGGITFSGLKTPTSSPFAPSPFLGVSGNRTVEGAQRAIIAALVRTLGGAVTIWNHDLVYADGEKLVSTQQQDPGMLILKLKES